MDTFGGTGGIAQYHRDLFKALAEIAGTKHIVVLPRLGDASGAPPPAGVQQLKARSSRLSYVLAALAAAATRGPFDYVYCGHLHLSPLAALLARFLRVPLWLQLHGWEAWEKAGLSVRRAAERADLITSVSRCTRVRFLSATAIDPLRVRVLPPAIGDRFSPGAKPGHLVDRYGLRGKTVLLTVGRMNPEERRKGHDKVIEALPEILLAHPNAVYLIVGDGEDRKRLEFLARSVGVQSSVVFAGYAAQDDLPQMYRLADLYVMPSTQEGFGICFLEAAASGVQAIGGHADGSADALADGAIGSLIDPADRSALVAAITAGLAGDGVRSDPASVGRFAFANFADQIGELVGRSLVRSATVSAA
jgi:phosphatidyl-myo-inositol dimannoside synthase